MVAAYKLGIIEDEALWLDMMNDRNLTSHISHQEVAERIFVAIATRYALALSTTVAQAHAALTAP